MAAQAPNQPLIQDRLQSAGEQVQFDAHLQEPANDSAGRTRVQRANDEVPSECGFDGDQRGFAVAHFADHYHFRVLAQYTAQAAGEVEFMTRPRLRLTHALDDLLDRVFDRDDVPATRTRAHQFTEAS